MTESLPPDSETHTPEGDIKAPMEVTDERGAVLAKGETIKEVREQLKAQGIELENSPRRRLVIATLPTESGIGWGVDPHKKEEPLRSDT